MIATLLLLYKKHCFLYFLQFFTIKNCYSHLFSVSLHDNNTKQRNGRKSKQRK